MNKGLEECNYQLSKQNYDKLDLDVLIKLTLESLKNSPNEYIANIVYSKNMNRAQLRNNLVEYLTINRSL